MSLETFLKKRREDQVAREVQWVKDLEVPVRCPELCSEDLLDALIDWSGKLLNPPTGVLQLSPDSEKKVIWFKQVEEYKEKLFAETLRRIKK